MTTLELLKEAIEVGHPRDAQALVYQCLEEGLSSSEIIDQAMIPAMKSAGEYYKNNDADIPRILSAARSVRKAYDILQEKFGSLEDESLGTIILGTVEGDLHDVGKNLVALMFRSAGFKVIDLGVDISEKQFLKAVKENPDASIVCISSLLTTALPEMQQVVKSLRKHDPKHKLKIMVGGGAVTEELAKQFAVSPSSIRRKLTELEKDGLVVRTHGGVKSINDDESGMSFFTRKHTNALEKRLIAIKALKIVHDGDMIFLDSSSTSYFLAEYLSEFPNVTVVTNGVDTLAALAAKKG